MRVIYVASVLLCAVILSILVPAASHAKTVTVVLKNGQRLENIYYSVDKQFQVLRYDKNNYDKKNAVSFLDIEAIYNDEGENIAPKLLGKYYRPTGKTTESSQPPDTGLKTVPQEEVDTTGETAAEQAPATKVESPPPSIDWRSEQDSVYIAARRRPWSVGMRVGGNFSIPSGEWFRGVNSGVGFEGDVTVFLTHEIGLRFQFSRAGLNVDDDFFIKPLYQPGLTFYNEFSSLTVTRYFVFVRYYKSQNSSKNPRVTLYTDVGLGAVNHKMKASTWVTDGVQTGTLTLDESETKFAMPCELGLIIQLAQNIGLDAGFGFDLIFIGKAGGGGTGYGDYQNAYIIDLKLGFIWLL